jgi:hypothetical protein
MPSLAALVAPRGEVPTGALYYPWMRDRSDAHLIELSEDEKRNKIDFIIPRK